MASMDDKEKLEHYKREFRLAEMAHLRRFKDKQNLWFNVYASSEDNPVQGARNEHLPPHIELAERNILIYKVEIPAHYPVSISDIHCKPDQTKAEKREILKWFQAIQYDKTTKLELSGYELSVRMWNGQNEQYEIKFDYDSDGLISILEYP